MIKIAPSILTADFLNLGSQTKEVELAGVDYIHLDVMDGAFVPNISFGPLVVRSIRRLSNLILDVHLMINNPERYIEQFAQSGADIITVHYEATPHLHRVIQQIKSYKCKVGVAINPSTNINVCEDVLSEIDLVVIMSVNPGFGGQTFIPNSLNKIKNIKTIITKKGINVEVEVDGGINKENIQQVIKSGGDILVVGSSVFNKNPIKDNIAELKKLCQQVT